MKAFFPSCVHARTSSPCMAVQKCKSELVLCRAENSQNIQDHTEKSLLVKNAPGTYLGCCSSVCEK